MKIFILEDDPDQAQLYKLWLEEHGHTCQIFITQAELLARLTAVSRRYNKNQKPPLDDTSPYEINPEEGYIALNGQEIPLTAKEFDLCVHFFKNPGRLVSRKNLLETIWVRRSDINTRTVDTHISRLRKKLQLDGSHGWKLISVYHQGYKMVREKRHVA